MADIFVSYTSSDRDWAFWIGHELEDLGHVPHIHEWETKGGDDILAWMQARQGAADHVLCVVSDEYLKAPYSTLERNAAVWQAASNRYGFLLLVVVKPCTVPMLLAHLKRCELSGLSEQEARTRLKDFLIPASRPTQRTPFPGAHRSAAVVTSPEPASKFPGSLSNIPITVPRHFVGRDDALAAIESELEHATGPVAIMALHGLRGVGKTVLAAAYAERHRTDYLATWWTRAETESTVRADLVSLGVRLGWIPAEEKEEPAVSKMMDRLQNEGDGILLIFDNAPDADALRPYLPRGGLAHVLITSNSPVWRRVAVPVEICVWLKEVGADYLIARTGRTRERAGAEALSEALGGLPLAHEQTAAYCERLGVSFDEYRKRFEAAPTRLLDDERDAPAEYHDRTTVAKTFGLAIDEAAKLHTAAEPLIVHAALLAPEPIPLFLFSEAREEFGKPLAPALAGDGLDEAVAALRVFALVEREIIADERDPTVATDCIRLHRLVRQVAAARWSSTVLENARRALVGALYDVYPQDVATNPKTWPRARRLDALAMALVVGNAQPPRGAEHPTAKLVSRLGQYRHGPLAAYVQARQLYERALSICEKELGPEDGDTGAILADLALLVATQGDLTEARPLYERALAICEGTFGNEHRETAAILNNFAKLLQLQEDFVGARGLLDRALAIDEKVLGSDHPDTATDLNDLGMVYAAQGDFARARSLLERAVGIYEKVLGDDHPNTNITRANIARLLLQSNRADEALPLAETGLAAHERILGQNHPWTRHSAGVTADTLEALGRRDEASAVRARYGIEPPP